MSEQYQCLDCGKWVLPGEASHDDCYEDDLRSEWEDYCAAQEKQSLKQSFLPYTAIQTFLATQDL